MEKHFLPQSNGSTSGFLHAVLLALYYVPTEACCCFTALQCKGKGLLCVSLGKNLLWWPWKHFLQADPMEILVYQVRCEQSSNPLQTVMNGLFLTRRSARQVAKHCEHCGFCIMLRFMALQCTETSAKAWWFLLALTDAAELTPNTTLLQAWPKRSVLRLCYTNAVKPAGRRAGWAASQPEICSSQPVPSGRILWALF